MSKELKIRVTQGNGSLKDIYWEGGGEVPQALSGLYTGHIAAQVAIDKYLLDKGVLEDGADKRKRRTKEL
jgi:hypothetical protein